MKERGKERIPNQVLHRRLHNERDKRTQTTDPKVPQRTQSQPTLPTHKKRRRKKKSRRKDKKKQRTLWQSQENMRKKEEAKTELLWQIRGSCPDPQSATVPRLLRVSFRMRRRSEMRRKWGAGHVLCINECVRNHLEDLIQSHAL